MESMGLLLTASNHCIKLIRKSVIGELLLWILLALILVAAIVEPTTGLQLCDPCLKILLNLPGDG